MSRWDTLLRWAETEVIREKSSFEDKRILRELLDKTITLVEMMIKKEEESISQMKITAVPKSTYYRRKKAMNG